MYDFASALLAWVGPSPHDQAFGAPPRPSEHAASSDAARASAYSSMRSSISAGPIILGPLAIMVRCTKNCRDGTWVPRMSEPSGKRGDTVGEFRKVGGWV